MLARRIHPTAVLPEAHVVLICYISRVPLPVSAVAYTLPMSHATLDEQRSTTGTLHNLHTV